MDNAAVIIEAISAVIAPYLGPGMARSAVQAQAKKLGADSGHLDSAQVEALLLRVGSGLNVFVGREKGATIVHQARQAVSRFCAS